MRVNVVLTAMILLGGATAPAAAHEVKAKASDKVMASFDMLEARAT